jgi:acetylornithine deacetylase/succinyl-diaminopimelate desuccinylase-like protein
VGDLIKRSLLPLKGNLVVAATVAEENGRSIGVRTLMEKTLPQLKIKPTYAILGEPTNLGLYYGHDGWIEMDICIRGANPFQVDDAASAIFEDLRSARNSDGGAEGLSLRRPRFEDEGGIRRATIGLERRLIGDDAADEVLGRVRHEATLVAQSVGAVAVEVAVRQDTQRLYTGRTTMVRHVAHAWTTDPFHPLMERARQALGAAGCQVRPGKFQLGRMGMGTAGSVLVDQFQVPAIAYGPGDETVAHTADEYVKTDSVVEAVYGTAAIVHSLVGIPVFGWTSDEI